jgi:hypothetical protein
LLTTLDTHEWVNPGASAGIRSLRRPGQPKYLAREANRARRRPNGTLARTSAGAALLA